MKHNLLTVLALSFSLQAFSQVSLPRIDAPEELTAGSFEEGTITRISESEIAEFLPWAQNAQNQLNRALNTARSMPLRDRLPHIERAVKSVVNRSGSRQYQMFMRFALNRGLLLVSEMQSSMNMEDIGAQENALDLLQRSIQVALSFYESDLSFQNRAQNGNNSTVLSYARFGLLFKDSMLAGVINVLDANAQYRLMYKLVEMTNWDLSRDAHANSYADSIVEAYELMQDLPAEPLADDRANLRLIRRLNALKILTLVAPASETRRQGTPSVPIGNVSRVVSPKYGDLLISASSNLDGVCKSLGFDRAVPGSEELGDTIHGMVLEVDGNGDPVKMVPVNSQAGFYLIAVTCSGHRSSPRVREIAVLTLPRANDMLYSSSSNVNGVCRSQGYRRGLEGVSREDHIRGVALVVDENGDVIRAEPVISQTGFYISRIICIR
ncbi:MAG: hypothetical protein LW878_01820 [Proteobacteria bacterium]|jgi:hypothetical protein|nr:hypothetical protein [Pseudomonadota bacterium]